MDDALVTAKSIVEACVPGAVAAIHDTGGTSQYDLHITMPDGTEAAMEVTRAADPVHLSTSHEVTNLAKGGQFIDATKCRKDWYVIPVAGARIKTIRSLVDEYLAAVEADGVERFFAYTDAPKYQSVKRILVDLGIEAGWVQRWKRSPQIGISVPGIGPIVSNSDAGLVAALHEASKTDNRRKLQLAGSLQRHLFVEIDHSRLDAWLALNERTLAEDVVLLPEPITHLWIAARTRTQSEYVIVRVESGSSPERPLRVTLSSM